MQNEHPVEEGITSDEQNDNERWRLARSIVKEAVKNLGIQDISEYKGEPLTKNWHVFSATHGDDLVLRMYVQGEFGAINADVSLLRGAMWAIYETELVLTRPDALELLDFTEEERPTLLHENARMIVEQLVRQIPIVFYPLISRALRHSIEAHVNNHVKPRLKEHWKELGKPEDFTLTPSKGLLGYTKKIDDDFEVLMKGLLGNRRAWLTNERREHLDEEHEQLRAEYQAAKDYYNQARKAFFLGKRNRTIDEWDAEWMENSPRMFPDLSYRCLSEINDRQPFELAHMHLGERYDYSPQYMAKLVSNAASLKRSRTSSKLKESE